MNILPLITFGLGIMNQFETQNKEWQERILKEWEKSKLYPRKKKKMVRKSLESQWRISQWSPFKDM